jgi:DNA-directed RNA polymerase beta subunit
MYKKLYINNYLLRIPNTLYYCLVYNKTYCIEFILGRNIIRVPLMVGSNFDFDNIDNGGYFVINGKKKVIVTQEVRNYKIPIIKFEKDNYIYSYKNINFIVEGRCNNTNIIYYEEKGIKINIFAILEKFNLLDNNYNVKDINFLTKNYNQCLNLFLENSKIDYLVNHNYEEYDISFENTYEFIIIITRLMHYIQKNTTLNYDDIYYNKLLTAGDLIYKIFKEHINSKKLNEEIISFVKSGRLLTKKKEYYGLSQALSHRNEIDHISHIRKIEKMNVNSSNVNNEVRYLYNGYYGYICCNETPESLSVGLTRYFSTFCLVTTKVDVDIISNFMHTYLTEKYNESSYKIFINNKFKGFSNNYNIIIDFKKFRKKNLNLKYCSIYMNEMNECFIYTTKGRYIRPMFLKKNIYKLSLGLDFDDLYSQGIIEYIDPYEMLNCNSKTHIELDQLFVVGLNSAIIPFLNNNQTARITFQNSMNKQCIVSTNKLKFRVETKSLIYSQYPICKTIFHDILSIESSGINTIIGIGSFNGFNIEDAMVFKKSAVDKYIYSISKTEMVEISFNTLRHKLKNINNNKYSNGLIKNGILIKNKDILVTLVDTSDNRIISYRTRYIPDGVYAKISFTEFNELNNNMIIRIYYTRYNKAEIGDKFSTRYSQKGVIGCIINDIDFPIFRDGIIPNIIVNSHSLSRITIGELIEGIKCLNSSKSALYDYSSGFSFKPLNNTQFIKKKIATSGIDGSILYNRQYIGICFNLNLKHQIIDKAYARSTGPINMITKQANEGKKMDGGLRVSELEKDGYLSYGASLMFNEKNVIASDPVIVYVCKHCKHLRNVDSCYCNSNSSVDKVCVTYGFKLLYDLMNGINVNILIDVEN